MYLSPVSFWATPWTAAHQALLSKGVSKQEYWSGLPCPSPGNLPDPGIESMSLSSPVFAGRFFLPWAPPEKPLIYYLSFTQLSSYLTIISLSIPICNVSSTHIYINHSCIICLMYHHLSIICLIYLPAAHLYVYLGGSHSKESACNMGDLGSIPGLVSSPGEGNRYPLRSSCLENPMDTGAWWAIRHGVAESDTT